MTGSILATAKLLMAPGAVHEMRILKAGRAGTISGYYDDPAKLAADAAKLDGKFPAIYITMNPCDQTLLARAYNRFKERAIATTSDADILYRWWLLIDCDPRRPSGISSTDREHARAITTACAIWDDLHGAGFFDPVVADSGNGGHLVYRIEAPNNETVTEKIRRLLAEVARRCVPDDDVKVDVSVFNAAQLTKLYGTLVCKGDSTPERPHRRSQILEIPEPLKVTTLKVAA